MQSGGFPAGKQLLWAALHPGRNDHEASFQLYSFLEGDAPITHASMLEMKYLVKVSQFVNKTFALWVITFGILGFIFPEIFKLVGPYVPVLLGVVMFGMGLTLSTSDFREIFRRPRDVFVGVVAQYTIMPLSAYATPALMYVFANQWLNIDPMAMFLSIVQIILLPIALGLLVHKVLGDKRLEGVVAALPIVSVSAIVVIAAAVVAATRNQLLNVGLLVFTAVAVQNALGMLLGYWAGRFTGMDLAKCKCLCFEIGMQNSGLAVALATVHFAASPMAALPAALGALWHNVMGPVVATVFQGWHEEGEKESFFDRIERVSRAEKTVPVSAKH